MRWPFGQPHLTRKPSKTRKQKKKSKENKTNPPKTNKRKNKKTEQTKNTNVVSKQQPQQCAPLVPNWWPPKNEHKIGHFSKTRLLQKNSFESYKNTNKNTCIFWRHTNLQLAISEFGFSKERHPSKGPSLMALFETHFYIFSVSRA